MTAEAASGAAETPRIQLPPRTIKGRAIHVFVIAYVVIQLVLPLRGLFLDKRDTRGNFSWNMYSQLYACSVRYEAVHIKGTRRRIDFKSDFARESKATQTYHRDRLGALHSWMCERHIGESEMLHGRMRCAINRGDKVRLIEENVDLCQAENWGILPEGSTPPRRRR